MTTLTVIEYPDPLLREPSLAVDTFDASTQQLAGDLIDTMYAAKCIGLSAVQVGVHQQMLVMDHSSDQSEPEVYVNPEILLQKRTGLIEERCVSVPGQVAFVLRATQLLVRARDEHGTTFERELLGMPAVCLQHEMDHFDGKLLVDRLNWFKRRRLHAALDKAGQLAASA
ncbi:MAG: peptide deformylase [Pseudomonadota bacterium]